MAYTGQKKEPISYIPADIRVVFEETDIDKVWDLLEKTFHLNKKSWKADFEKAFLKAPHEYSKMEVFYRYGHTQLQTAINTILARKKDHPTWDALLRFVLKNKLESIRQEADENFRKYGRSSYYKVTNRKY